MSVPPAALRSSRVRNLSRSPVEYSESNTLPMVLRMKSCGILARFSAQSVSIRPMLAWSTAIRKPLSSQKSRTDPHSLSGVRSTRSQRSPSWRMNCTSAIWLAAVGVPAACVAAWPAW